MAWEHTVGFERYAALFLGLALGCSPTDKHAPVQVTPTPLVVQSGSERVPGAAPSETRSRPQQNESKPIVLRGAEPPKAEGKEPTSPRCTKRGKALKVYAVGSSTMAGLAFVMRKTLQKKGVEFESGAKPSSGLSRPDFYDWPAEVPKIVKRFDPDVFVVSMGTNDNQAVRLEDRSWVRSNQPQWEEVYRARIRKMLLGMNEGRKRRVIWIGPNSVHGRKKGSRRYRINEMMRDEVERFDGDTHYIDLYRLITHDSGRLRRLIQRKSDGRYFKARAKDGVHLSLPALRFVLAEKVYDALEPCLSMVPFKRRLALSANRRPRRAIAPHSTAQSTLP